MGSQPAGLLNRSITDTPLAILDFETTGLNAGIDRVVEVSVVRLNPGHEPRLVLDTLVNPKRLVAATEIHGITDEDVADAPAFEEIAGNVAQGLCDCVVAAYNVYFDMAFLEYELGRAGLHRAPPHLCLMYMRPLLGLGNRCSLDDACRAHGISRAHSHRTAADVEAAAQLWHVYLDAMANRRVRTFKDLGKLKSYKFLQSFHLDPLSPSSVQGLSCTTRLKSRSGIPPVPASARAPAEATPALASSQDALYAYWEALKAVLCDLNVTEDEMVYLAAKREELHLTTEEIRALHARAFANTILKCAEDRSLSDPECQTLRRLHQCLSRLGWAPGE